MAARIRDLQDLLKYMIQGSANTTPENPAEILNGYQSGTESLILKETIGFKEQGHGPTYHYQSPQTLLGPFTLFWYLDGYWNESQYS